MVPARSYAGSNEPHALGCCPSWMSTPKVSKCRNIGDREHMKRTGIPIMFGSKEDPRYEEHVSIFTHRRDCRKENCVDPEHMHPPPCLARDAVSRDGPTRMVLWQMV